MTFTSASRPRSACSGGCGTVRPTGASASVEAYPRSAPFATGRHALRPPAESRARELIPRGIDTATRRGGRGLVLAGWMLAAAAGYGSDAMAAAPPPEVGCAEPNRLVESGSPYLLQHACNPVDWLPWGEEAFARARREDKPLFVSVGYSTCYWCHVANRTLYADPEIAGRLNAGFVSVKVDREQRPDVDRAYQLATRLLTGGGGWPNNVFVTPEGDPFFAGGYFPREDDHAGRPGFARVLGELEREWREAPEALLSRAAATTAAMRAEARRAGGRAAVEPQRWRSQALERLAAEYDAEHGGISRDLHGAKFPRHPRLRLLLEDYGDRGDHRSLEWLTRTLDEMALGGIHDHLGSGFHRYTIDSGWSIPHFEKMLYDNAQLLRLYAEAYALTGRARYREVAHGIARYLRARLEAPDGGFYTAEDAEAAGLEGSTYLWTRVGIESVLGARDAARFLAVYELVPLAHQPEENLLSGEPLGVLRVRRGAHGVGGTTRPLAALAPLRVRLLAVRDERPQPLRDETRIVALNGLAIEAFAVAGDRLSEPAYIESARRAAARVWQLAYRADERRLHREIFRGTAQLPGFPEDYALLGLGLLALAEVTGEARWAELGHRLAVDLLEEFLEPDGSLRATRLAGEPLLALPETGDLDVPSGTSAALELLLRIASAEREGSGLTTAGERPREDALPRMLRALAPELERHGERWASALAAITAHAPAVRTAVPLERFATAAHVEARATLAGAVLRVEVRIAPGFHVNANPASFDYLIPTALAIDGVEPRAVRYPKPVRFEPRFAPEGLDVYEGTFVIEAVLPHAAVGGPQSLRPRLRAQACDEEICLPPATIPVEMAPERP